MEKNRSRTVVMLVSMVLAAFLWLLNSLSKTYDSELNVGLSWTNPPAGLVVANRLPDQATYQVSATGWQLLYGSFNKRTLHLELDRFGQRNLLLSNNYLPVFKKDLPRGIELLHVYPDSILLSLEPLDRKKVPLELSADLSFEKSCGLTGEPVLHPDSVWLSGPSSALAEISIWKTQTISFSQLRETMSGNVNIQESDRLNIDVEPSTIHFTLPVDVFTEGSLDVPITPLPNPSMQLIPDHVLIEYLVPLSKFEQVKASDFRMDVNLNSQTDSAGRWLDVELTRSPDGLKQIKWHPMEVELIVQHRD
jgi:hypothetical protein